MKIISVIVASAFLSLIAIGPASAQGKLCKPCEASGEKCCGLKDWLPPAFNAAFGYGFKTPETWCRKNQPACSKR